MHLRESIVKVMKHTFCGFFSSTSFTSANVCRRGHGEIICIHQILLR